MAKNTIGIYIPNTKSLIHGIKSYFNNINMQNEYYVNKR